MKAFWFVALFVFFNTNFSMALTIQDLLDAVERQPGYQVTQLGEKEAEQEKHKALALLLPKLNAFGRYERYNSPTNLRPLPPTEVNVQAGESIPFSREIIRYGLNFDAPLYVHELFVQYKEMSILQKKAEIERKLDLVRRQASVVSLNSALTYLKMLGKALEARCSSLQKTLEDMAIKVNTGRSPESELLKIEKTLNDLEQQRDEIRIKQLDTLKELKSLTGQDLAGPVPMNLVRRPESNSFPLVTVSEYAAEAAQKELDRRRAARLPSLWVSAFVSGNDGEAYNTDKHIYRSYHEVALVLKIPLFDETISSSEAIARIRAQKARQQLAQTRIDVESLAEALSKKISVIEHSISVAEKSVEHSQRLLEVAKVALQTGRMIVEEYLRYESDVFASQATLYQAKHAFWEAIAQQAVLYGSNLKGVVQ